MSLILCSTVFLNLLGTIEVGESICGLMLNRPSTLVNLVANKSKRRHNAMVRSLNSQIYPIVDSLYIHPVSHCFWGTPCLDDTRVNYWYEIRNGHSTILDAHPIR